MESFALDQGLLANQEASRQNWAIYRHTKAMEEENVQTEETQQLIPEEPRQADQFADLTNRIINPSRKKNPAFYHPCCRSFNKREWKGSKKYPEIVQKTRKHLQTYRLSSIFTPGKSPLTSAEACFQFYKWIADKGIVHDHEKPFAINQRYCTAKEEVAKITVNPEALDTISTKDLELAKKDHEIRFLRGEIARLEKNISSGNREYRKLQKKHEDSEANLKGLLKAKCRIIDGLMEKLRSNKEMDLEGKKPDPVRSFPEDLKRGWSMHSEEAVVNTSNDSQLDTN